MKRPHDVLSRAANLAAVLIAIAMAALPTSLGAQSLSLAPAEIDRAFTPGQPFSFQLGVSNDSEQPVSFRVAITDLWYNADNEKTFGVPGSSPHSAADWLEPVPAQVTVPAHGSQQVKIMVTPPLDAVGGYYATVFVESKPELVRSPSNPGKGIYANFRLGALVLLAAENSQKYSAGISGFKLKPPAAASNLRVDFTLLNDGNTHIFPRPSLALVDDRRRLAGKAEGEVIRFLPGQKKELSFEWPGTLAPGRYEGILTILYGNDKVLTQSVPLEVGAN